MGKHWKTTRNQELYPFMEVVFAEVESVKFETEGADHDRCEASIATRNWARSGEDWDEIFRAKTKFCLCRHAFKKINTRRDQIKVSCYSFFWHSTCDDNPQTSVYQKKGYFPTRRVTGWGGVTIFSQLRVRRKKSPVSLADIEAILEIIEESWDDTSKDFGNKPRFIPGLF